MGRATQTVERAVVGFGRGRGCVRVPNARWPREQHNAAGASGGLVSDRAVVARMRPTTTLSLCQAFLHGQMDSKLQRLRQAQPGDSTRICVSSTCTLWRLACWAATHVSTHSSHPKLSRSGAALGQCLAADLSLELGGTERMR